MCHECIILRVYYLFIIVSMLFGFYGNFYAMSNVDIWIILQGLVARKSERSECCDRLKFSEVCSAAPLLCFSPRPCVERWMSCHVVTSSREARWPHKPGLNLKIKKHRSCRTPGSQAFSPWMFWKLHLYWCVFSTSAGIFCNNFYNVS